MGDAVEHNKYGVGIVKEITDKIIIVSFSVEEKKFPFPMAFDDKFLFQCKNEQSTPITDVGESYIPTSIFDIGLPDDYLPF